MNFTLLDSLSPHKYRKKLTLVLSLWGILAGIVERSADRRKNAGERRQKEKRRRADRRYKVVSHFHHKRYRFAAINEYGEEDVLGAILNIIIVHGLRGYGELYIDLAKFLRRLNFNVLIVDLPAHGNSVGEKCHIYNMRDVNACIESAVVEVSADPPREGAENAKTLHGASSAPIVFIDFSMGASYALHYLMFSSPHHIKHRVIAAACLGMPLNVGTDVSLTEALNSLADETWGGIVGWFDGHSVDPAKKEVAAWKMYCAPILGRCVPWYKIKELPMDKETINHDPVVVEKIWNDPLIYKGPLPAGTAYLIMQITRHVLASIIAVGYENFEKVFGFSIRCFRGEFDPVAKKEHYEQAGIPTTDYPGMFHEILKGPGSEVVIRDIVEWINGFTSSSAKGISDKQK